MTLLDLISEPPPLHEDEYGNPVSWGIGTDVLSFLAEQVGNGRQTLETGSGVSTLVFAAAAAVHRCVTPSTREVQRIKDYCLRESISLSTVTFLIGSSEDILPQVL